MKRILIFKIILNIELKRTDLYFRNCVKPLVKSLEVEKGVENLWLTLNRSDTPTISVNLLVNSNTADDFEERIHILISSLTHQNTNADFKIRSLLYNVSRETMTQKSLSLLKKHLFIK